MPTGQWNAITDVEGVQVGQMSLIDPARSIFTGVTAILPHAGNLFQEKVPAGFFQGNGFGKMMGTTQLIELGELETPILLTNTLNVPEAAAAVIEWTLSQPGNEAVLSVNPLVGETNDGRINDIRGRHLKVSHALAALETAGSGPIAEGNVGAGTGTVAFGLKGGIGTSSRLLPKKEGGFTVGVLVQANYGGDLHMLGRPVGRMLAETAEQPDAETGPDGSVMIIVATDAPLSDRNLSRLAKRAILGIGRTGGVMSNGSGDYVLAFSTDPAVRRSGSAVAAFPDWPNARMTPLFAAVVEATEEAVYNALIGAEAVTGRDGVEYKRLPIESVVKRLF